jgi:anti-sigma regulatory factor (Ser/Thr protein kinase)
MNGRPADVQFAFDHGTEAARNARHAVAALFDGPDDPIADAVLLTVSELVTNVVMHSGDGGVVKAWNPSLDGCLRVEVEDHSPIPPVVGGEVTIGGRGLLIVDRTADAWGVEPRPAGKVIWAEFSRQM